MHPLSTNISEPLGGKSSPMRIENENGPEGNVVPPHETFNESAVRDKRRRSSTSSLQQPVTKVHKRKAKHERVSLKYSAHTKPTISINDVKNLTVKSVTGTSTKQLPMVDINAAEKVKKTLVVVVPGVLESDFAILPNPEIPQLPSLDKSQAENNPLEFVYAHFENLVPTTVPGGDDYIHSPLLALMKGPLNGKAKKKRAREMSKVNLILNDLLLKKEDMERFNYPLHRDLDSSEDNKLTDGWVETKKFSHGGSHTFALDCEFCQSASGKVLTRVSIVNFQAEVVYDTYVKPAEEITDYVTRYSGITEEILRDETTTLKDVQEKVLSIVSSDDILIGHSLESDLNVMKIRHPLVIDTSLVYEHHRGPPFRNGLKYLTSTHLGRTIQDGERSGKGHSSVEDLIACLDLVKLKLLKGPDFGAILEESIFRKVIDAKPGVTASVVDYLKDEYSSVLKDTTPQEVLLTCVTNDDEAVERCISSLPHVSLLVVTLRELEFNSKTRPIPSDYTGTLISEENKGINKADLLEEERKGLLRDLNRRLRLLHEALPSDSVMIVTTDGGSTKTMNHLRSVKRTFDKHMREGVEVSALSKEETWDFDKLGQLHQATGEARKAVTFVASKE